MKKDIKLEFHNEKPNVQSSTIEAFWNFQRASAEMNDREFVEYLAKQIKFATPGQLEGARTCVNWELSNFQTRPERKYYLSTYIVPLIENAIEHPADLQQTLNFD